MGISRKQRPRGNSINFESKVSFNSINKNVKESTTRDNKDFNDSLNDRISTQIISLFSQYKYFVYIEYCI